MLSEDKRRNARTEIVKPRYFILSSKTLFRYETNILLRDLKFKPTHMQKNLNLNLTYKITRAEWDLLSFTKTKKETILRKLYLNKNELLSHLETGIDI